jgi:branched-subunit amino acid transport protein
MSFESEYGFRHSQSDERLNYWLVGFTTAAGLPWILGAILDAKRLYFPPVVENTLMYIAAAALTVAVFNAIARTGHRILIETKAARRLTLLALFVTVTTGWIFLMVSYGLVHYTGLPLQTVMKTAWLSENIPLVCVFVTIGVLADTSLISWLYQRSLVANDARDDALINSEERLTEAERQIEQLKSQLAAETFHVEKVITLMERSPGLNVHVRYRIWRWLWDRPGWYTVQQIDDGVGVSSRASLERLHEELHLVGRRDFAGRVLFARSDDESFMGD